MGPEMIEHALYYAEKLGWPVFPVKGKIPACAHGFKDASTQRIDVEAFWGKNPDAGIAIATGNGIGVLDIDPRNGGEDGFETLLAGRTLPETPMALTGGGGRHYYFSLPLGVAFPSRSGILPGVDWKADGGYVVAPPSPHSSGKNYAWEASSEPSDVPLSPLPNWLMDIILSNAPKSAGAAADAPATIPEKIKLGARHEWLTRIAGKLRWQNLGEKAILSALLAENESGRFDPPVERAEIERIAYDYARKAAAPPPVPPEKAKPADTPPVRVVELVGDVCDMLLHPEKRPKGFRTGFYLLDNMTGGLHRGEVTILGARTSMGKSSLALRIAENVARDHAVLIFTVEMTKSQLTNNLLVGMARIDSHRARTGVLLSDEAARLSEKIPEVKAMPLWLDDTPGMDVLQLADKARVFVKEHPDALLVIDYLQIVAPSGERVFSRQEQVSDISWTIQQLARELNVPILTMAQLNRGAENRDSHRPNMADLRESGSIEHDAAVVILMHRPGVYDEKVPKSHAVVQVVKNRQGPTGEFDLVFLESYMRFENAQAVPPPASEGYEP